MDVPCWLFFTLIEHAGDEGEARRNGSFTHAQEESRGDQAAKALCCRMAHQDASPY